MNRRVFLSRSAASAAVLAFPLLTTGCDNTTVSKFVSLIAQDAANLATYFGAGSIASQITTLASKLATYIANWQTGGTTAEAIQAINDMIDLINQIPIAANYASLIDLLLSALAGLLLLLPSSATASITPKAARRVMHPFHYGGFDKKSMSEAKRNFESQWKAASVNLELKK